MRSRNLLMLAGIATASASGATLSAQSTAPAARLAVDLCPMPVHGLGTRDTMPTYMPDASVEYFIRVVPAACRNPLEPDSIQGAAANGRLRNRPFRLTPEQAGALRRWRDEQRDSAGLLLRNLLPRRRQ